LASWAKPELVERGFEVLKLDPKVRAESLNVEQFKKLFSVIAGEAK
jgi:hypothetical protein